MRYTDAPKKANLVLLLAEDSQDDRFLMQRALRRCPIAGKVIPISDGEQVLAYMQGHHPYADRTANPLPDVLLIDHRMPRLSGLGVLCWLRSDPAFEALPVVLLSGVFSPAQTEMAQRLSAACCTKSLELAELTGALQKSVAHALKLTQHRSFGSGPAVRKEELELSMAEV